MQFKITNFPLTLDLQFGSVVTEDQLLESWHTFIEKQLTLQF